MPRKYNTYSPYKKHGQEVVQPFKREDWERMTQICVVEMEQSQEGSYKYYQAYRNYMLLVIGVNVGARISDLLEFTPRTFAGGCCVFKAHKTGKPIRYNINKELYDQIKDYENMFHITINQFLFRATNHKGNISQQPISRQQAWKIIKRLAGKAGIDYMVGTHSLRKSYGRWQYDNGVNLTDVSAMLQHDDPTTTLRYICIDSEQIKERRENTVFETRFVPSNKPAKKDSS